MRSKQARTLGWELVMLDTVLSPTCLLPPGRCSGFELAGAIDASVATIAMQMATYVFIFPRSDSVNGVENNNGTQRTCQALKTTDSRKNLSRLNQLAKLPILLGRGNF